MSIIDHQQKIREQFANVDHCPISGERIFFENAGGALTLQSVLDTTRFLAGLPDNQGRDNATSRELVRIIQQSKQAIHTFFNASTGQVFVGESGTELLFRLIRTAISNQRERPNACVIGSTLEHPATCSAADHWAKIYGMHHILVPHDNDSGTVDAAAYRQHLHQDMCVATILHTSPVTGIGVDIATIAAEIRAIAPECLIIVDGIQHASHGLIDIDHYGIDGYVISAYKVFSRHGYGVAWVSDRMTGLDKEQLLHGPVAHWEFGTRDTAAYATMHDVVKYFQWLGEAMSAHEDQSPRENILAAAKAIHAHEHALCSAMIHGIGNHRGLAAHKDIRIIGGKDNPAREGLICFYHTNIPSPEIVTHLNSHGIRTHTRKADYYSHNILAPLDRADAVRVSMCHYNSLDEVARLLEVMEKLDDQNTHGQHAHSQYAHGQHAHSQHAHR